MDTKTAQSNSRNRFLKLSLKKNHANDVKTIKKLNRSSGVIILDESFDKLQMDLAKNVTPKKIYSPIVVNDSCEQFFEEELPKIDLLKTEPSKTGHILNSTEEEIFSTPLKESRPSFGGWSPAQNIVCATPKQEAIPSTPKDIANESLEECSIKKIQQSQKKLLDDLYGDTWKSIPSVLKTLSKKKDEFNLVPKKLFDDDGDNIYNEKARIRNDIKQNKLLYLTESDTKRKINRELNNTEKKSKKKLYTEVIPNTPEPKTRKKDNRNGNSTAKKLKGLSVTQLVEVMKNDVDSLTKKVENIRVNKKIENNVTPSNKLVVNRLSFLGSLADNVPSWRCHVEAIQYQDNYKSLREQLARRLFVDFNKIVFDNVLDSDLPILWDTKLRSTAGTTTNRLLKTARGDRIRTSSVKLSSKVVDTPQRLRDTLIHELCHAATWLIDGELRAGHGPLWKKWATRALEVLPELGEISRCHDMEIYFKYCYKCTKCGYSIKRHSKSIDVTKKCCGYCHGTFEVIVNRKNKDGVVVSTPARRAGPSGFALYVKQNYGTLKDGSRSHAQVMKLLGEQFSARKKEMQDVTDV